MKIFERKLNVLEVLKHKSAFLFGPRSTGKTFWLKHSLPPDTPYFSLNNTSLYSKLMTDPSELRSIIEPFKKSQFIIIDEIQKAPKFLILN